MRSDSWIQEVFEQEYVNKKGFNKAKDNLNKVVSNELPSLYMGERNGRIVKKRMNSIMCEIREGDYREILYKRDLFDAIVRIAIEKYGWKSVPVPILTVSRREASRFTSLNNVYKQQFEVLENIFLRTLVDTKNLSSTQRAIQIMLSAVIYGGLFEKPLLVSLMELGIDEVVNFEKYHWIDIPANDKKAVPGTIRRWFADPITVQIIKGYKRDSIKRGSILSKESFLPTKEVDEKTIWKSVRDLMNKYRTSDEILPDSFSKLIKVLIAKYSMKIPPYLIDYASGTNPSYSMLPKAWMRAVSGMQTDEDIEDELYLENNEKEKNDVVHEESKCVAILSDESVRIRRVEKAILSDEVETLKQCHSENKSYVSSTTVHITEFYLALRKGKVPGRFKHKLKSLEAYFLFSKNLVAYARGRNIVKMDMDSVESLYEDVLEKEVTLKRQAQAGKFLRSFHNYLVKTYDVEKIVFVELDGFVSERHSVNANVITPQHYGDVLNKLWPSRQIKERLEGIRYLMTVLAYRLNMRRQETRRLRVCDIRITKTQIFVKIMNTEFGDAKSISGKRWQPAHDLLNAEEMTLMREWYYLRLSETSFKRGLFFTEGKNDYELISSYKTFNVILKTLRGVTGDKEMRFHSLRHSFATWLLVSIEANRMPEILDKNLHVFSQEVGIQPAKFRTLLDGRVPTKKILYQLALLMGHSSPSMTLLHYIHSCDWILHHWMCKQTPYLSFEQISPLLGRNTREVKKVIKNYNIAVINKKVDLMSCLKISEWPVNN